MTRRKRKKYKRRPQGRQAPPLSAITIEFAQEILAPPLEMTSSEGAHCALALAHTAWNREVVPNSDCDQPKWRQSGPFTAKSASQSTEDVDGTVHLHQ